MKLKDAFKRLLDGQYITREDWDPDEYIMYDEQQNAFLINSKNGKGMTHEPLFGTRVDTGSYISFDDCWDDSTCSVTLYDDDKNKIYDPPINELVLNNMKYKIIKYTAKVAEYCADCKLSSECDHGEWNPCNDEFIIDLGNADTLRLYNLIKEEVE